MIDDIYWELFGELFVTIPAPRILSHMDSRHTYGNSQVFYQLALPSNLTSNHVRFFDPMIMCEVTCSSRLKLTIL